MSKAEQNGLNFGCDGAYLVVVGDDSPLRDGVRLVWEIDRQLQEDIARPIISNQMAAGCWQPWVKNYTIQTNSIYNGWRFEDIWLER